MLHCDAAAQGRYAIYVAIADRLGVVEEPVQSVERNVGIDLFIDIKRASDRLIVCRVEAPWSSVFREQTDDRLEIGFHIGRHFRARLAEILEVCCGINQHLSRTVVAIAIVSLAG